MTIFPAALIRGVRLVPVGSREAPDGEVDVRIRDGVVTEVGAALAATSEEEVHDAGGRHAIPGLWDHHVHFRQWGLGLERLDTSGARSVSDVTALVAAHVAAWSGEPDAVIQGWGHRCATWAVQPSVAALDAVSGAHPVFLVSGDGHHGWLNSAALRLVGLPATEGVVDETEWYPVFARLDSLPGAQESADRGVAEAARRAAAMGLVGIVDMELTTNSEVWPRMLSLGVDHLRVRGATYASGLDAVIDAGLRTGDPYPGGHGLLRMGPLKVISDGSLNTRTAACCEPYADADTLAHPYGKQNASREQLTELARRASEHGLEIAFHAIGDAAVGVALDAIEQAGARGSIEHAQLVRWDDVSRMARLGLRASVQPHHLWDDRDVAARCWPDRQDRCYAFRSLLEAGVTLALGSDAPVSPLDPWLAMAAAVHRSSDEREPWHGEQAITAEQALAASTDGQTIAVGNRGDIVLLDEDPLARSGEGSADIADHLRRMPVAATFVGGRATFDGR